MTIPAGCTTTSFSFWLHIDTAETTTTTAFDKLTITANGTTLATFSNLNHATGYQQHTYSLGSFAGSSRHREVHRHGGLLTADLLRRGRHRHQHELITCARQAPGG